MFPYVEIAKQRIVTNSQEWIKIPKVGQTGDLPGEIANGQHPPHQNQY